MNGRALVALLLGPLLILGIVARLYLLNRSLWLDEAWLANAIQAASLSDAIYYNNWLQTTPPIFVVLSRFITEVFGTSNIALRALPALSGIASILLFSLVTLKLLKPSFAMISILLFVFAPQVILYSQSLKQYSTDVFCTVGLVAVGFTYIDKRSDLSFYVLLFTFFTMSFLSYPVVFFSPFLLYAAILDLWSRPGVNDPRVTIHLLWPRLFLVVLVGVLVVVINYVYFIAPNNSAALTKFFLSGFYQGHTLTDFIRFYSAKFSTMTEIYSFVGSVILRVIGSLVTVIGCIYLWASGVKSPRAKDLPLAVLLTSPIVGVVIFNMLGLYPLVDFNHRLLLFAVPITVLLYCIGLQFLANIVTLSMHSLITTASISFLEWAIGWLMFVAEASFVLMFFNLVGLEPTFAEEHEQSEESVAYLARRVQADDILYVHASMQEQFKLYNRVTPVLGNIIYGGIGMPCCPRNNYRHPKQESLRDVASELVTLRSRATGRLVWLLITGRNSHRLYSQRDDIAMFERGLATQDCRKLDDTRFTGVYIGKFGCADR